jgi:transcription elongation factor Elf1
MFSPTMTFDRLILECPHCGKGKYVTVAISETGSMGPVKCDDCKARGLLTRIAPGAQLGRVA